MQTLLANLWGVSMFVAQMLLLLKVWTQSVVLLQYEAQIDAIVEQAQQVGLPEEGLWCCTI